MKNLLWKQKTWRVILYEELFFSSFVNVVVRSRSFKFSISLQRNFQEGNPKFCQNSICLFIYFFLIWLPRVCVWLVAMNKTIPFQQWALWEWCGKANPITQLRSSHSVVTQERQLIRHLAELSAGQLKMGILPGAKQASRSSSRVLFVCFK